MLKIYHVPKTRSIRLIWLCEELHLPHVVVPVDFSAAYRASPEWRAKNPVGKVLVIEDDEFVLFESGAIVEYLLEKYGQGRLRPTPGTQASGRYLQWCWFAEATFARPLGDIAQHTIVRPENQRIPAVVEDGRARSLLCLDAVDAAVANGRFLIEDDFTAADIMMGYSLYLARAFGVLGPDGHANANAYYDRLLARPGFAKALAGS